MVSILKLFHDVLCKFRFTRGFVHHFFGRWVLFLASLGRRLGVWRPWSDRGRDTFQKAEKAECSSPDTGTRLKSRECGVAASYIPASANHPSLHNTSSTSQQPQASGATPPAADLTVEPPSHPDHVDPSSASEVKIYSNRRSTDSNIRSCSSDRLSIIQAHSRESVHTPISQPTQIPRDPLHQPGRGPSESASPSMERRSRSPSLTERFPRPRLGIDVTNPLPQTHVDVGNTPVNASSFTSYEQAPLSPLSIHGHRGRRSSTSVVPGVQNLSIDLPPLSPSTDPPSLAEEPYVISSPLGHSSSVSGVLDPREGLNQRTPTTSVFPTPSNFDPPDRRRCMVTSEQIERYRKKVTVPREETLPKIPPLTRTFPYSSGQLGVEQGFLREDCAPWVPATHPGGALYFFDQDRRLFTDTNMLDPELRGEIERLYHSLQRVLDRDGVVISSKNCDLVLDVMGSTDKWIGSYYYACHETRCLFWLEAYDATFVISKLPGVRSRSYSLAHVKHRLEALYWTHWSLFPAVFTGRRLCAAVVDELVGILSHGCMDVMTSSASSTLPYNDDSMQKMLSFVQNAKESDTGLVYHTAGVTRLLAIFAHWRFQYFHGQHTARLVKYKTVYPTAKRGRTLLITSLSPVLFFAPEGYLEVLELMTIWVDEVIIEQIWKRVISKWLREWEQLILLSTVMLSVNVGFLAIPGVVVSNLNSNITGINQVVIFTSPAQIAGCVSIVASTGSIVTGLLLIRRNYRMQDANSEIASEVLSKSNHRIFGLEPLAIILSLPWALATWSTVSFFVALLLYCFGTSNTLTRIFVAVTSLVVIVFIGWCTQGIWGSFPVMKLWSGGLLRFIMHALASVRAMCHQILVLINRRLHPESPSSSVSGPAALGA